MFTSTLVEIDPIGGLQQKAYVALVNMPFARTDLPSIPCGLLKAVLARAGHKTDVHYLNMELAHEIGAERYAIISDGRFANALLGEWLFSVAAFGYSANETEYLAAVPGLQRASDKLDFEWLCSLRNEIAPQMIDRWTSDIAWDKYTAVGFTSTFVQNNATFALARAIKNKWPRVVTVFGGANFSGGMGKEFLRKLPYIDYIVDGEGEEAIVALCDRLANGRSGIGVPGVSGRSGNAVVEGSRAKKVESLDSLPSPDYEDYFAALYRLGKNRVVGNHSPALLFETARGCWWGEKHHCTFCGLNANDMTFRSKSAERVVSELEHLTRTYQTLTLGIVDNIMDMKYVDQVCRRLIEARYDYQIFWEVKANLTPAQLSAMASAGIREVQPGIESLSTHVLALMRKGITMLKNVRFLKWANYFGIVPHWNILTGFPGESEDDYSQQRRIVPLLRHLQPPTVWSQIWLERFSPYFFDPRFPVKDLKPAAAYKFIYPEAEINLNEVAYFFDYTMEGTIPIDHLQGLFGELRAWKDSWDKSPRPRLVYRRGPQWMEIIDRRYETPQNYWLYDVEASVYEFCGESDRTVETVCRHVRKNGGSAQAEEVAEVMGRLCEQGLMLSEDGHYLSLAQPLNRNWFSFSQPPALQPRVKEMDERVAVAAG